MGGLGLFTNAPISEGELVSVWGGCVYNEEEIRQLGNVSSHFRTHPVEVAPGFYLASTNVFAVDDVERINHSCEPNVGIKGQIVLLARRPIASGEELTIDYETLSPSQAGAEFHCTCGSATCRERIDGHIVQTSEWVHKNQSWLSWRVAESLKPGAASSQR